MHKSVLLHETIDYLLTDPDGIYVDCTLGGGGHSSLLAEKLHDRGCIYALDQDLEILRQTAERLNTDKIHLIHANFRDLKQVLEQAGVRQVDGIMMDLGVSSFQLDEAERGFSFHADAPLDMRMDRSGGENAAGLVNTLEENALADIIFRYGEERYARRIAAKICAARSEKPIRTTGQLVEIIKSAVPGAYKREKHPARRTFQALRIAVNREMEALEAVLPQAVELLKPGGRLCIITFHSLEDRMVKNFYREMAVECICPPKQPVCTCNHHATLKLVKRGGIAPSKEEEAENSRARSARLRVAEKTGQP